MTKEQAKPENLIPDALADDQKPKTATAEKPKPKRTKKEGEPK